MTFKLSPRAKLAVQCLILILLLGSAAVIFWPQRHSPHATYPEVLAFIEGKHYPCPNTKTMIETQQCMNDAIISYMEKGEKETSKKLWYFDEFAETVAYTGTASQKIKLLEEYDRHTVTPEEHWSREFSPEGSAKIAKDEYRLHIGKLLLLLSLERMDDAVAYIQQLASSDIEIVPPAPQIKGLDFLINQDRLDEAITFFEKTQFIQFHKAPNIPLFETITAHVEFPLIGALLAKDRLDDAKKVQSAMNAQSVFPHLNNAAYFDLYRGYKATANKEAFAKKNFKNFSRDIDWKNSNEEKKVEFVSNIKNAGEDWYAIDAAFRKYWPHIPYYIASKQTLPILFDHNSEFSSFTQEYIWRRFLKGALDYYPLTDTQVADALILYPSTYLQSRSRDKFSSSRFLSEKLLAP